MAWASVYDDPDVGEQVRRAYIDQGHDIARIAADNKMSMRTVIKCMRHFGIPSRPAHRPRELHARALMMQRMRDGGVSIAEIGRRFEVTPRAVYGLLKRYQCGESAEAAQ